MIPKNLIWLLIFFGFSCKSTRIPHRIVYTDLVDEFHYPEVEKTIISVHRGGGDVSMVPENCFESFEYFTQKIPSIIECDVRMSKDSVLMLLHDYKLDRTTNGTGAISDYNYQDLTNLSLKDNQGQQTNYQIPKLESALLRSKGKILLELDVKREVPYKLVTDLLKKTGMQTQALIITYSADQAAEVYRLSPETMISVTVYKKSDYERISALGVPDENMIAFIGTQEPDKDLIDFLHQKNILCILGTIGNLDKKAAQNSDKNYQNWQQLGVDIFATDRAMEAYQSINK